MSENLIIAALLPLTALMLVTQTNPYHALVIRGILGAVAALVYALFGAADVALTEALVGTMLSITLYAVAVRSSMSLRLGVVAEATPEMQPASMLPEDLLLSLRQGLKKYHLRLEVVPFLSKGELEEAIAQKNIHGLYLPAPPRPAEVHTVKTSCPQIHLRLPRLQQLLQSELSPSLVTLVSTTTPSEN